MDDLLDDFTTGKKRIWTLHYRHGRNPNLTKNFVLDEKKTLDDAIKRGRSHCQAMGYRYTFILPFLSSLKEDEDKKKNGVPIPVEEQFGEMR
jgi:hypothetical protein